MATRQALKRWLHPLSLILAISFVASLPAHARTTTIGAGCTVGESGEAGLRFPDHSSGVPGYNDILLSNDSSPQHGLRAIFSGNAPVRVCYFRTAAELHAPDSNCDLTTQEVTSSPSFAYVALIREDSLQYCPYRYEVSFGNSDVRTHGAIFLPSIPNSTLAPILKFEEPANGSISNGIANIRGWIVSDTPVSRIDLYIDNVLYGAIPHGGIRSLVGNAYPQYPNADQSGFSMAYGFSNLSLGPHTMKVMAYGGAAGLLAEKTSSFSIVAFDQAFIGPSAPVTVGNATFVPPGVGLPQKRFQLQDVELNGTSYDLQFEWNPPTQKFEMINIDH